MSRSARASCQSVRLQKVLSSNKPALAGKANVGRAKGEFGRGLAAAGVVVEPAGGDYFDAVAQLIADPALLQVVEPDCAGNRAVAVAQLEVGLDFAAPDSGHLADQLDLRPLAHLRLDLAGVDADLERPRVPRSRF